MIGDSGRSDIRIEAEGRLQNRLLSRQFRLPPGRGDNFAGSRVEIDHLRKVDTNVAIHV